MSRMCCVIGVLTTWTTGLLFCLGKASKIFAILINLLFNQLRILKMRICKHNPNLNSCLSNTEPIYEIGAATKEIPSDFLNFVMLFPVPERGRAGEVPPAYLNVSASSRLKCKSCKSKYFKKKQKADTQNFRKNSEK